MQTDPSIRRRHAWMIWGGLILLSTLLGLAIWGLWGFRWPPAIAGARAAVTAPPAASLPATSERAGPHST